MDYDKVIMLSTRVGASEGRGVALGCKSIQEETV